VLHPWAGANIRIENFPTAQRQGFAAGRAMAGSEEPYDEVPWFRSGQHDLMQRRAVISPERLADPGFDLRRALP